MGILTGPSGAMYALTTIPGTAAVAMTAFKAKGNSVELSVTTDTGGVGSLTFTAEKGIPRSSAALNSSFSSVRRRV